MYTSYTHTHTHIHTHTYTHTHTHTHIMTGSRCISTTQPKAETSPRGVGIARGVVIEASTRRQRPATNTYRHPKPLTTRGSQPLSCLNPQISALSPKPDPSDTLDLSSTLNPRT